MGRGSPRPIRSTRGRLCFSLGRPPFLLWVTFVGESKRWVSWHLDCDSFQKVPPLPLHVSLAFGAGLAELVAQCGGPIGTNSLFLPGERKPPRYVGTSPF